MSKLDAHGGWPSVLQKIVAGDDLSQQQASDAMADILAGDTTAAQIAGFLVALSGKGESISEMTGMVGAMMEAAEPLDAPPNTIDIVGTGGAAFRRRHALNVSTMASLVAAAAGVTVCKHGNLKATSTSGSFDFIGALGVNYDMDSATLSQCLDEVGVGFVFARAFHPAMRHAAPVRAQLGIPTVFNILGPLANPAKLRHQVVGVASVEVGLKMAHVLRNQGSRRAWVVVGDGGLDELTSTGPSVVFDVTPDGVARTEVKPTDAGLSGAGQHNDLAGGSPMDNVAIFNSMLEGSERGPRYEMVLLNAAAGLVVGGVVENLDTGVERAAEAVDSGAVAKKVAELVGFSQRDRS